MTWKLIKVLHTEWIQDDSGYYTLINYIDENTVRLDWLYEENDKPIISFRGTASDVHKRAVRFMAECVGNKFSHEHAAYIGSELARCELTQGLYVQD